MTTKETVGNAICCVGGSKGGVGKSMVTMAILDRLMEMGQRPLLIECHTSNPDVWKAYKEEVSSELVDLDEADGGIHLVNTCDGNRDKAVLINTAARNNSVITRHGRILDTTLGELDPKHYTLWPSPPRRATPRRAIAGVLRSALAAAKLPTPTFAYSWLQPTAPCNETLRGCGREARHLCH